MRFVDTTYFKPEYRQICINYYERQNIAYSWILLTKILLQRGTDDKMIACEKKNTQNKFWHILWITWIFILHNLAAIEISFVKIFS